MRNARLKTFFFLLLGTTLLIFLAWLGVLYLAKLSMGKLALQMSDQEVENQKSENLSYVKRLTEETSEGRTLLDTYFLEAEEGLFLIERVTEAGKASRVDLKIDKIEESDGISLHFTASGTFQQISHFLVLVENLPYHMEFQSLKLNRLSAGEGKGYLWSGDFLIGAPKEE